MDFTEICKKIMVNTVDESELHKCLSDEGSFHFFSNIQDEQLFTITSLKFARKQFYSNLNMMIIVSFVQKIEGKYSDTTLGQIVH